MSPTTDTDAGDFYEGSITIYATVHAQKPQGRGWIDQYFTLSQTVSTLDTVGDVQAGFNELATPLIAQSGLVLVSIEVVAPAFFEYFQGF
jgi:hypothetical protein